MSLQDNPKRPRIDIAYVARLARLELSQDEEKQYAKQLNDILEYIDKLNKLDTKDVEPTSHVLPIANVMRQDKREASLPVDETLNNAPLKEGNFFKVPKIIE